MTMATATTRPAARRRAEGPDHDRGEARHAVDDDPGEAGLLVGEVVGGNVIEREIGRGGMGMVYLARRAGTDEVCALKEIRADMAHRPDIVERFQTETNALAKLRHKCIVALLDAGTHRGRPYIVMEYVKGRTLREVLRLQREPLGLSQTLQIALRIARALRAAHRAGVVHRDLKPENVLLQKGGALKVVDFGIAKLHDGALTTHRLTPMATPLYAAPEQFSRGGVDGRTDVYALGLMILEMATGRHAFSDLGETMPREDLATELQRRAQPNRLLDEVAGCPPSLSALVERTVAKRREARPTAAELVRELRREGKALGYALEDDDDDAGEGGGEEPAPRITVPMPAGFTAATPCARSERPPAPKPQAAPMQGPSGTHLMAPTVAALLAARGQTLEQARQEREQERPATLPPPPAPSVATTAQLWPAAAPLRVAPVRPQAVEPWASPQRASRLSMLTLTLPSPRKWLPFLVVGVLGLAVLFVLFALVLVGAMWAAVHLGLLPPGRGAAGVESAPTSSASAATAKEAGR
jgi:eukaryotic-like serine/threonine-protein kinase